MKAVLWCSVMLLGSTLSHAADYAKEVQKCVQTTLGSDFKNYQYLSAPIDNFGTATMYPPAAQGQNFDIKTAGLLGDPQTWWTFTDADRIAAELGKLRPEGKTGPIAATCNKNMTFSLSVVLPALFKLLSVNASVDYNKSVQVQISFTSAKNRLINWTQLAQDDKNKLINSDVSAQLGAHNFLITIGDVALEQYTATLTFKKNLDVKAKAQLTAAWQQFGKDSSLTADFSNAADGTYKFTAKNPVIAALFVGAPPAGVSLEVAEKSVVPVKLSSRVLSDLVTVKPSRK